MIFDYFYLIEYYYLINNKLFNYDAFIITGLIVQGSIMGGVQSGTHTLGEALWVHERQRQKCHR